MLPEDLFLKLKQAGWLQQIMTKVLQKITDHLSTLCCWITHIHMLWGLVIKEGLFLALLLPIEDDDLSKKHSCIIACLVIGQLIQITYLETWHHSALNPRVKLKGCSIIVVGKQHNVSFGDPFPFWPFGKMFVKIFLCFDLPLLLLCSISCTAVEYFPCCFAVFC